MSPAISPQHQRWLDDQAQLAAERAAMAQEARHEQGRAEREAWAEDVLARCAAR